MAGKFIVFEGGEGSGKTTQAKLLYEALKKEGRDVLLTKEPGGDEGVCGDIRSILLNERYSGKFSNRTEFLLFEADRAQHVERVIEPALEAGKVVICDRYEAATFAYQSHARAVTDDIDEFVHMNAFATRGLTPDFFFWIDLNPEAGLQRNIYIQKRDRFEKEDLEFHKRVRQGYEAYFDAVLAFYKNRYGKEIAYQKLDGDLSIKELHNQVLETIKNRRLI